MQEEVDWAVEQLWFNTIDLLKESFESFGYDMGATTNQIIYKNYLIDKPLTFTNNTFTLSDDGNYGDYNGNPKEIDALIDFNSEYPFAKFALYGPPADSNIKIYWNGPSHGFLNHKCRLKLTFSQYISACAKQKGTNLQTIQANIPEGNSYTGKGNGLNNPTNLSYCDLAKAFGSTGAKIMSDKQKNAVFPDMLHGLAANMVFLYRSYHGQNVCHMNNRHQGYVNKDKDRLGMAALRLRWVSGMMNDLGISDPGINFNLNDKNTLFAFVNGMSKRENSLRFQRGMLESAYNLAKQKGYL